MELKYQDHNKSFLMTPLASWSWYKLCCPQGKHDGETGERCLVFAIQWGCLMCWHPWVFKRSRSVHTVARMSGLETLQNCSAAVNEWTVSRLSRTSIKGDFRNTSPDTQLDCNYVNLSLNQVVTIPSKNTYCWIASLTCILHSWSTWIIAPKIISWD